MDKIWCQFGENYYKSMNDGILSRNKRVYIEGMGIVDNPFASNHRIPSGFLKKIIDQKVSYLLGNGVGFKQVDILDKYFKETFDEFIMVASTEASKKGEAWVLLLKDNNQTKIKLIKTEELSPVFDEFDNLIEMTRSYGDDEFFYKDIYDLESVKRFKRKKESAEYEPVGIFGHYTEVSYLNGQEIEREEHSFGQVPFVRLKNNPECLSDLFPIKSLIDVYDIIYSDFANNIDDMQEAFLTLKGYSGDSKDLGEFMKQLKMIKAIPVGEDGDVGVHQLQIPVTARETFLRLLRQEIFDTAMAVDVKNVGGGSVTNVHIKAMFADLDMKANKFESEIRKFIYLIFDFIEKEDGIKFVKELNFNRSIIINRSEYVESVLKTLGVLSQKTVIKLLEFDIDVEEELKQIALERGEVAL